jgi:hypothetical protein
MLFDLKHELFVCVCAVVVGLLIHHVVTRCLLQIKEALLRALLSACRRAFRLPGGAMES